MNQAQEASKSRLIKTLAVIGFVVLIIVAAWLAVQVVRMVPAAFSSLASLAESVEDGRVAQNEIDVTTSNAVVNADQAFAIEWSDLNRNGSYVLSYECIDGVSLDIRIGTDITSVACGADFVLPKGINTLDARFSSEKNRLVDIPYQISFIRDGETVPFTTTTRVATVVNADIPENGTIAMEETETEEVMEEETMTPSEPTTPSTPVTPSTPSTPTGVTYTTVLTEPVSDPNGYTELEIAYLGVGELTNSNEFIPRAELDENDNATFQFQVKNIGTKTSGTWTFEADLTDGDTFKSKTQSPLKPNERAVLTIAFGNPGDDGLQEFGAEIKGGNDRSKSNNRFTWAIKVND